MISPAASRPSPDSPSRAIASYRAPRSRSVWSYVAGGIGNVLAAGGVVCVALVILAVSMNISLIMFKTGSMSPEIPADSVAVVKEISADEVRVGGYSGRFISLPKAVQEDIIGRTLYE